MSIVETMSEDLFDWDAPVPECPPWCEEPAGHGWDWGNDDGSVGRGHGTQPPTLPSATAVSAFIWQQERSLNGITRRDPVTIHLDGNDLTADAAERVAAALTAMAAQLRAIEAAGT